jgi:hypothetical protein
MLLYYCVCEKLMATSITIIDETTSGTRQEGPTLSFPEPKITIRNLITARIYDEVERYNNRGPDKYYGLVQPSDIETALNSPRDRRFKKVDGDMQAAVALAAFESQRLLVLLPNRQAESLDETVTLSDGDEVTFLRLIPLIGG